MKFCPICKTQYPGDANFCPQETCATSEGPQRLLVQPAQSSSRFSSVERLGGGRTGEVWKAIDSQNGTEVAYKTIAPEVLPTQAAFARAEREFKQLMRVSSPKIATIVECEKTPAGGLAIAMELCQGEALDRLLAAGPMPFEKAKAIVSQVGLALLEAQKVGLVHRDVAPKNILVAPSGDVKVINFPLAKPLNERVAGVADYLSPEQVQGKPVDQRSNTYSLAAILYHLLTGEPPFQGASEQAVLEMQVSTPVLPPTQRRPGAGLPPDADKLILKAMDKSSSRRHLTLRLFLNELEALKEKPAAAANAGKGEAGLAKTMMFGGNQAEIARMVAEARAAKAAASSVAAQPASSAPIVTPAAPMVTPAPAPSGRAAEIGQTIMAGPAAPHAAPHAQPLAARAPHINIGATPPPQVQAPQRQPTPAPFGPTPPPVAPPPRAAAAPIPAAQVAPPHSAHPSPAAGQPATGNTADAARSPQKAGSAFRETLWFKQGDVEQMVADAKAKLQAAGRSTADAADVNVDARPLEERYVDDGSVTVEDRKKFSLRTGGTVASIPTVGDHVPGEQMDEKEMVGEISGGRRTLILVIAAVVILGLIVVVAMMVKGKGKGSAAVSDTATQTYVADSPQPTASPGGLPPGRLAAAADAGSAGPPGSPAGATAGSAVGTAGGTTKSALGGATGEAKVVAKKPAPAPKKKPAVVKHPAPKRKR